MGKMTSTKIYVFGLVLGLFRAWAVPKQKPGEGALGSLGQPGTTWNVWYGCCPAESCSNVEKLRQGALQTAAWDCLGLPGTSGMSGTAGGQVPR